MDIIIRPIQETDSLADLAELLHQAYKPLADLGFRFVATYQTEQTTRKLLRGAHTFVALADARIVGTISVYSPVGDSMCAWYQRKAVWYFGQFGVAPDCQRLGVGGRLLAQVEETARQGGAAELALDTAEGASHLIAYYGKRGYRPVDHAQWPVTNYRSVILSKPL